MSAPAHDIRQHVVDSLHLTADRKERVRARPARVVRAGWRREQAAQRCRELVDTGERRAARRCASTISSAPPMPQVTTGRPARLRLDKRDTERLRQGIWLAVDVGSLQERRHVAALSDKAHTIGDAPTPRDRPSARGGTVSSESRCGPPTIQYVQPSTSRKLARASSASRFPFHDSSRPTCTITRSSGAVSSDRRMSSHGRGRASRMRCGVETG